MKRHYWIVASILVFCLSAACRDKAAVAEAGEVQGAGKLEEQNKELVRSFIAALDKNDFSRLKELVLMIIHLRLLLLLNHWDLSRVFHSPRHTILHSLIGA